MSYRTALITGASSGIGRGLALALAARGTHVVVAARREAQLESLVEEITRNSGSAEKLVLDVEDGDRTHAAVRAADDRLALDLVVANAGVGDPTPMKKTDWKTLKRVIDINYLGAVATLTGALPGMLSRNRGHLAGVASVAGFRALPKFSAYSSTKAALITFLESTRLDLHKTDLAVTAVCPGFVRTEMTANVRNRLMVELDDAVRTILRALDRKEAMCTFPLPVATAMRSLPFIPNSVYDFLITRVKLPY